MRWREIGASLECSALLLDDTAESENRSLQLGVQQSLRCCGFRVILPKERSGQYQASDRHKGGIDPTEGDEIWGRAMYGGIKAG